MLKRVLKELAGAALQLVAAGCHISTVLVNSATGRYQSLPELRCENKHSATCVCGLLFLRLHYPAPGCSASQYVH
jgi:hypothetical protein